MSFLGDIDKGLRKIGEKIEQEDKAYITADCPKCGAQGIKVHKMRARHGHVRCPECGTQFVMMMERD